MNDYDKIIEFYANGWHQHFGRLVPSNEWGNKEEAEIFLKKYWLSISEYEAKWKLIEDRIFINQSKGLPEMLFGAKYELFTNKGGYLFTEEEFHKLKKCLTVTKDQSILVVENTFGKKIDTPVFRFKFPAAIQWAELTSGNFISSILLEMPIKEYFVFGETAAWGKYAANEYEFPLDVIGFRSEYADVFRSTFKLPYKEQADIYKNWLPPKYQ